MNLVYLLLALGILVVAFVFLFIRNADVKKTIKAAVPAALIASLVFSVAAVVLVLLNAWSFNPKYLTLVYLWKLPVEELLFYFSSTLAGLGIYSLLNTAYPNNGLDKFSLSVSNIILGICIALLFFTHSKWYSAITFGTLFIFLFYIEYLGKIRFMYRFYRAYLVSLLLFYITHYVISQFSIVTYHDTINLRLAGIPFESHFYYMSMLLLGTYLFEYFKRKIKS